LNEEGRRQAEALAQRLAKVRLKAIYSSPLERTMETAEAIARSHDLPIHIREGIGEARYGEWTGQKLEDLAKTDLWRVIQFYPSAARFPGGEAMREMQARAVAEIDAIVTDHPEDMVAIVSHSDVIKVIIAHYIGMHLDLFQRLEISPASLSILVFGKMGSRLVRLNDTSHLPDVKSRPDGHKPQTPEQTDRLLPEDYL
jgi:probable phosphoglycerate mutase